MELLRQGGLDEVLVVAGGIIPDEDVPALNELGIHGVFGPGTPTGVIVDFIRGHVA
jgi:methylmalonyl-CoA mutase C-terminal domain/subunit